MDFLIKRRGGRFAIFSKEYDVTYDGSVGSVLRFDSWKHSDFSINQRNYIIRADGKGRWLLQINGTDSASCQRQATGPRLEFSIRFDDEKWQTKPVREWLMLRHDIWANNRKIARITPQTKMWSNEIAATFIQPPRLEIAIFSIWLIGIHSIGIAGKLTAARAEAGI